MRTLEAQETVAQAVDELRASEYIREKELGNGISSFNFTRSAFSEGVWNDQTIRARGLFINTESSRIIARSYDKFFAVNERPETQLYPLARSLSYPVDVYRKENGYLGIVATDTDGKLFFASKSTTESDFARWLVEILRKEIGDNGLETLREKLCELDASAIFEVIDPQRDPHIVSYDEAHAVLLDIVFRTMEFATVPYKVLEEIAHDIGIDVKKKVITLENSDSFIEWYKSVAENSEHDLHHLADEDIEGYVYVDSDGDMGKVKLSWYRTWKMLRGALNRMIKMHRNANYDAAMMYDDAYKRFGPQRTKEYKETDIDDVIRFMAGYVVNHPSDDDIDIVTIRTLWKTGN